MQSIHQSDRGRVSFNMTPMIDVVFLLIIFFLVSSHLAQRENRIEVDLPSATTGHDDQETSPRVTLTVLADGSLLLAGTTTDTTQLPQQLRRRLSEAGDTLELRIRGDRRTPYRVIDPILASAARAGVWNVTFAVVEKRGPES